MANEHQDDAELRVGIRPSALSRNVSSKEAGECGSLKLVLVPSQAICAPSMLLAPTTAQRKSILLKYRPQREQAIRDGIIAELIRRYPHIAAGKLPNLALLKLRHWNRSMGQKSKSHRD